jgi:hypothetical protein
MPAIPSVEELLSEGGDVIAGPAPSRQRRVRRAPSIVRNPELEGKLWDSYQRDEERQRVVKTEEEVEDFRRDCLHATRYLEREHGVRLTVSMSLWVPGQTSDHPMWDGRANNRAAQAHRPVVDKPLVMRYRLLEVDPRYAARRAGGYDTAGQIKRATAQRGGPGTVLDWELDDQTLAAQASALGVKPSVLDRNDRPNAADLLRAIQADSNVQQPPEPKVQDASRSARTRRGPRTGRRRTGT